MAASQLSHVQMQQTTSDFSLQMGTGNNVLQSTLFFSLIQSLLYIYLVFNLFWSRQTNVFEAILYSHGFKLCICLLGLASEVCGLLFETAHQTALKGSVIISTESLEWERGGNLVPHAALSSYWVCLLNTQNTATARAHRCVGTAGVQLYSGWE